MTDLLTEYVCYLSAILCHFLSLSSHSLTAFKVGSLKKAIDLVILSYRLDVAATCPNLLNTRSAATFCSAVIVIFVASHANAPAPVVERAEYTQRRLADPASFFWCLLALSLPFSLSFFCFSHLFHHFFACSASILCATVLAKHLSLTLLQSVPRLLDRLRPLLSKRMFRWSCLFHPQPLISSSSLPPPSVAGTFFSSWHYCLAFSAKFFTQVTQNH